MNDETPKRPSRRRFLTAAAASGAALSGGSAPAGNAKYLPPNVPEWTRMLGNGVATRSYGKPSRPSAEHDDLGCSIVRGKKEHKLTWDNLERYRRNAWLDYNRASEQLRAAVIEASAGESSNPAD